MKIKVPSFLQPWGRLSITIIILTLSVVIGLQVTQIRFNPFPDSIALSDGTLSSDTNHCNKSIPDTLLTAQVFDESFSEVLSKCMDLIMNAPSNTQTSIKIPHEWRRDIAQSIGTHSGRVVYRFEYDFKARPEGLWGIALPSVSQNVAVFLNGDLLGWGGSFEVPIARNGSYPQLFTISNNQFKRGKNFFEIFAVSYPAKRGFLGNIYIAPVEMLLPAFKRYKIFREVITNIITVTLFLFSFFMVVLWRRRTNASEYGWLSLVIFCWFIHALDQSIVNIPFRSVYWDGIVFVSRGFISVAGILFVHRFLGVEQAHRQFEGWILFGGILLAFVILLASLFSTTQVFNHLWNALVVAGGIYIFIRLLLHAFNTKDNISHVLGLSGGIIMTFAVHDLMVIYHLRPLYDGFYFHYGAPFLLAVLSWIMLQRFNFSLDQAERSKTKLLRLNKELEGRVDERGRFIAKSYKKIFKLERKQDLIKERARIMRDMHDGIGVYLNCILRQLDHQQLDRCYLKEAARRALDDLRLMIDSLGSVSSNLSAMLGMFRTRMDPALKACNITLEWRVDELPELSNFGPERALNLLRILQEAVTNSIKHSNANTLSIAAYSGISKNSSECVVIEVCDNGEGFVVNGPAGNGLLNMSLRAKNINADLNISSHVMGTCVIINLPLHGVSSLE